MIPVRTTFVTFALIQSLLVLSSCSNADDTYKALSTGPSMDSGLDGYQDTSQPPDSGSDTETDSEPGTDAPWDSSTDTGTDTGDAATDSIEVKWFPGHYIFAGDSSNISGTYHAVGAIPVVRGVQIRYYWDDLEPSENEYDFTPILNDLDPLDGMSWKLIIQLQNRIFGNGTQPQPQRIPDYLKTDFYDGGAYYDSQGNSTLLLGNDNVRDRFIALLEHLGNVLDSHPLVAGVNLPESGIASPEESHPLHATWSAYRANHWENILLCNIAGRAAFPSTPFVQYFGHGPTQAAQFEPLSKQHGFGIGNPDVILRGFDEEIWVSHNYNLAANLLGFVPLIYSIQSPDYPSNATYLGKENPVPDTFVVLRDVLQTNFATWGRSWGDNQFYWDYVVEFLESLSTDYPNDPAGGLNSACPTVVAPCAQQP